jgi:hypothetical protein
MTKTEALNVLAQACAKFVGTLQDHTILQQALGVLKADERTKPEPKPEPTGEPKPESDPA